MGSSIIFLLFSFFLEATLSLVIDMNQGWAIPLFSVVSVVVIYPFFMNKDGKYIACIIGYGLCYDLIFTDTFLLHGFVFGLLSLLVIFFNRFLTNTLFNVVMMSVVTIAVFRTLVYVILLMADYHAATFTLLLKSIFSSLVINILYVVISYYFFRYLSRKYKIQRID